MTHPRSHEGNPALGFVVGLALSLPFWAAVVWWVV